MKRYLTCLLFLFFSFGLKQGLVAQAQLQVYPDSLFGLVSPANAAVNDVITYSFIVANAGNVDFNDSLVIMARVNSNTFVLADSGIQFIPVFDSKYFSVNDVVTLARYDGGVNIVVIWPTSPSMVGDSTMDSLIVNLVGIKDGASNFLNLKAFPNPTTGDLYFQQSSAEIVSKTSVIGLNGQVLQTHAGLPSPLMLSELAQGLYLVRIETEAGKQMVIRIQKR